MTERGTLVAGAGLGAGLMYRLGRFAPNPDGTTRLELRISYEPGGGALAHTVAALFGADPKSKIDADLLRMKTLVETGSSPQDATARGGGE
ncbi:MAG TPA: hypothetical protein VEM57_01755 [Candidatus Binatus sp.]|nr:hypothetical protein [Candidatus Binatus sp.]